MASKSVSDAQQLTQRNRELAILNEIAAALKPEVDLGAALNTALKKVADLLQLRTGWIWLLQEACVKTIPIWRRPRIFHRHCAIIRKAWRSLSLPAHLSRRRPERRSQRQRGRLQPPVGAC